MNLIEIGLLIYFSVLIGLAIAMSSWIAHDKRREKRIRNMVYDSESWCQQHCRYLEDCWNKNKDPDEAWKELDDHCCNCPMSMAIDVLERDKAMKERGKNDD